MNRVRGELSFEAILGMAFLALILATVIVTVRFHENKQWLTNGKNDITSTYNQILSSFRRDARLAIRAEITAKSVSLYDNKNVSIATYNFSDNKLHRTDRTGTSELLIEKIEKVSFRVANELPNLLMVNILPADKMQIPFFTSFALRGVATDEQ
ncbi:MAG: hypothetical protein EOM80_13055 [Erysipelotrichia bacterium]|nr:hypothetical protein [Erysipelotrichia bacterium]